MSIIENVPHLFNPNKTLADFPKAVEATFPLQRVPIASYYITAQAVTYNTTIGKTVVPYDKRGHDMVHYMYRNEQGKEVQGRCELRELMVLSFFANQYDEDDKLITVIHHDRHRTNYHINNLVPIFTLEQLQSYFVYKLNIITGENFDIARSHHPEEYTLEHYLVGDKGTIFGLDRHLFIQPTKGKYALYNIQPTYLQANKEEKKQANKKGKKQANKKGKAKLIAGHTLVAATFVGKIPLGYHVHHVNGHPRDNKASNLIILSASDHMKLHKHNFQGSNNRQDMKHTCTECLKQDMESVWCPCQKAFCRDHIIDHQKNCWYKQHDDDPEYNKFFPLMWENSKVPGFHINKKGQIQGITGTIRSSALSSQGYPVINLSKKLGTYPIHQLMGHTFFSKEFHSIENGVMDHINSNRQLNHIENLRPVTQQQNNEFAKGVNVVVVDRATEATATYDTINSCVDVFGDMYPSIEADLLHADKTVEKSFHIFHRDPKRTLELKKFYLD